MNKPVIAQYELKKIQTLLINNGDAVLEVALKTLHRIMDTWKVSVDDKDLLIGCVNDVQPDSSELVVRASIIISIYSSLHRIFERAEQADEWPSKANDAFNKKSAIEYMSADISNMRHVQSYLLAYANN